MLASIAIAEILPIQIDRKDVKHSDHVVHGIEDETGAVVWERRFPEEANFAKLVEGGILVGCDDGAVYFLDRTNGAVLWQLQLGGKEEKVNGFHGSRSKGWLVSYHDNIYWLVSPKGELIWTLR